MKQWLRKWLGIENGAGAVATEVQGFREQLREIVAEQARMKAWITENEAVRRLETKVRAGLETVKADLLTANIRITELDKTYSADARVIQERLITITSFEREIRDRLLALERRAEDRTPKVSGVAGLRKAIEAQGGLMDLNTRVRE